MVRYNNVLIMDYETYASKRKKISDARDKLDNAIIEFRNNLSPDLLEKYNPMSLRKVIENIRNMPTHKYVTNLRWAFHRYCETISSKPKPIFLSIPGLFCVWLNEDGTYKLDIPCESGTQ